MSSTLSMQSGTNSFESDANARRVFSRDLWASASTPQQPAGPSNMFTADPALAGIEPLRFTGGAQIVTPSYAHNSLGGNDQASVATSRRSSSSADDWDTLFAPLPSRQPQRKLSHSFTEPEPLSFVHQLQSAQQHIPRRASLGGNNVLTPIQRRQFSSILPPSVLQAINQGSLATPSKPMQADWNSQPAHTISILDQFSTVADAARHIEYTQRIRTSPPQHAPAPQATPAVQPTTPFKSTVATTSPPPPFTPSAISVNGSLMTPKRSKGAGTDSSASSAKKLEARSQRNRRASSPILERLRASQAVSQVSFDQILGHVAEVSMDQHGSRYVQDKLGSVNCKLRKQFFNETLSNFLQLSKDVFGNYVIQKLFAVSNEKQRFRLAAATLGHVLELSLQMYGCRVVQMAFEFGDSSTRIKMAQELQASIIDCINDHNGNHVIQRAVEFLPPTDAQFIYLSVFRQLLTLSRQSYGCRVVQRILEHSDHTTRVKFSQFLRGHAEVLIDDRYGNYVMQQIFVHVPQKEQNLLFEWILPRLVTLSTHKYASNVAEKLVLWSSPAQKSRITDHVLNTQIKGGPALLHMIKDQYANYVVQKILENSEECDQERLNAAIRPQLAALKKQTSGKHLVSIEKLVIDPRSSRVIASH